MAGVFVSNAANNFLLVIDELEKSYAFIRVAAKLRPRLNEYLNRELLKAAPDANHLVTSFLEQKGADPSIQYRGLIVILAGGFEQMVRMLVRDAVVHIGKNAGGFDALSDKIKNHNTFKTGKALTTIFEPVDHAKIDYHALAKNLSDCIPGSKSFALNADAFSVFISNITPSHLVEILKPLDVSLQWDDFGREKNFATMFGTSGTRATAKAVEDHLKGFIRLRNQLAHTGIGGPVVTEADFELHTQFFRLFTPVLAKCVSSKL